MNIHLLPQLTEQHYADAVSKLMKYAVKDCGGSSTCALVLLNAYDYTEFRFDITGLCNLDGELYHSALVVIRCRSELYREPHEFIENGSQTFEALRKQWQHLSLTHGELA